MLASCRGKRPLSSRLGSNNSRVEGCRHLRRSRERKRRSFVILPTSLSQETSFDITSSDSWWTSFATLAATPAGGPDCRRLHDLDHLLPCGDVLDLRDLTAPCLRWQRLRHRARPDRTDAGGPRGSVVTRPKMVPAALDVVESGDGTECFAAFDAHALRCGLCQFPFI